MFVQNITFKIILARRKGNFRIECKTKFAQYLKNISQFIYFFFNVIFLTVRCVTIIKDNEKLRNNFFDSSSRKTNSLTIRKHHFAKRIYRLAAKQTYGKCCYTENSKW